LYDTCCIVKKKCDFADVPYTVLLYDKVAGSPHTTTPRGEAIWRLVAGRF
jgi:hypothetical protein